MNEMLDQMIEKYHPNNNVERINVIKQVLQEIALSGLSKSHFFDHTAFYGGTCLRIVYGLNRFSEDLDFALIDSDPNFNLDSYFPALVQEFNQYGININVETKKKVHSTGVQSAFLKANTLMLMLNFYPSIKESNNFVFNQKIKIKFEIDLSNPPGGKTEIRSLINLDQCQIRAFDLGTLFAGKIAAVLCRSYQNRVKGRDYYDYLFFMNKKTPFNLKYLENKLKKAEKIPFNQTLTLKNVKDLLYEKFLQVDYKLAIDDVINFIDYNEDITSWNKDLFISTLDQLKCI